MRRIAIALYREKAKRTVDNFLTHVNGQFYDGLLFHRVMSGFVIQTGLLTSHCARRLSDAEFVPNEGDNGLKNLRYSVGMARGNDPHSAKSEFFIREHPDPPGRSVGCGFRDRAQR
jgi:cyclophilin family peptidyl-prolyl cis-trans isomerase